MAGHRKTSGGRGFGLFLIVLGILFLLDQYNILYFDDVVSNWWPLILVFIGLTKFSRKEQPGGFVLLTLGILFLLSNMGYIYWGDLVRLWPVMLIMLGVSIAFGSGRRFLTVEVADDEFEARTVFGGVERHVTSQNLHGGEIMVVFGGAEVDLRDAKPADDCFIRMSVVMGGAELRVPADWRVEVMGTPIFGGVEDRTASNSTGPVVRVSCNAIMGGIEIYN